MDKPYHIVKKEETYTEEVGKASGEERASSATDDSLANRWASGELTACPGNVVRVDAGAGCTHRVQDPSRSVLGSDIKAFFATLQAGSYETDDRGRLLDHASCVN